MNLRTVLCLILVSSSWKLSTSYPHGAPVTVCDYMMPQHGDQTQPPGTNTYVLDVTGPGNDDGKYTVTLSSSDGTPFQGFLIRAAYNDPNRMYSAAPGQFIDIDHGSTEFLDCFDAFQSGITHVMDHDKASITATWVPSEKGDFIFLATIAESEHIFWGNVTSPTVTIADDPSPTLPPTPFPDILQTSFDYSVCGVTYSCFGYPDQCIFTKNCGMLVMYWADDTNFYVNLVAETQGYVALGISTDDGMGDDSVLSCTTTNEVLASITDGHDNIAADNSDDVYENGSISYADGILNCNFSRPLKTTVTANGNSITTDLLNNDYYLLLAMGYTNSSGNGLVIHTNAASSQNAINLASDEHIVVDEKVTAASLFAYDQCGVTQSCFGYPTQSSCVANKNCLVVVGYKFANDELHVQLAGVTTGYVAVGLGYTEGMDNSSVIQCLNPSNNNEQQVGVSINIGKTNYLGTSSETDETYGLDTLDYTNEVLYCDFSRPSTITVTSNDDSTAISIDLAKNLYYIQLAIGDFDSATKELQSHGHNRAVTTVTLDMTSTKYTIIDDSLPFDFNYNECGITRTCLGSPDKCVQTQSCEMLVSYYPKDENNLNVDMFTTKYQYIAFGLSTDTNMGDDSVIECMLKNSDVALAASVNKGHSNDIATLDPSYYTETYHAYTDGAVQCSFTRPVQTSVAASSATITTNVKNSKYYVLIAGGQSNGNDISEHDDTYVSPEAMDLMSTTFFNIGGRKPDPYVIAHGSLMVSAWLCTVSIAIFLARFYKDMWPDKMLCSVKIWFAMHRALNIITVLLTMIAFIVIFVYKKGFTAGWKDNPHAILGCFVMGFAIIQPFGSLFRCAPGTPRRPLFNWAHLLLGNATWAIAIVTIYFAVKLRETYLPTYVYYILAGYLAFSCLMFTVMEYYVRMGLKKKKEKEIEMRDVNDIKEEQILKPKSSNFKKYMLCLYVLGAAGFCVGVVSLIATAGGD